MHKTQFPVNSHCPGVDHMSTLSQTSFRNLGILCQMAHRSDRLIADTRDDCIAILNSQTTATRMKNTKEITPTHENKK
jgi:hypothetical protein